MTERNVPHMCVVQSMCIGYGPGTCVHSDASSSISSSSSWFMIVSTIIFLPTIRCQCRNLILKNFHHYHCALMYSYGRLKFTFTYLAYEQRAASWTGCEVFILFFPRFISREEINFHWVSLWTSKWSNETLTDVSLSLWVKWLVAAIALHIFRETTTRKIIMFEFESRAFALNPNKCRIVCCEAHVSFWEFTTNFYRLWFPPVARSNVSFVSPRIMQFERRTH